MKTIIATAYAVNPYKGSEDGMGWNFICQIARYNKVIAVTRENNRPHIEQYMSENPDYLYENMSFLYFDLPKWARFWKKGNRGAMFYFYLWQRCVPGFIKKNGLRFDIAHNLNFHNDWTPSFLWKLGKPFVWGPVGHHPRVPTEYLRDYQRSYRVKESFTWHVKQLFWTLSPSLKKSVKQASHIFCMNSHASQVLNLKANRYSIIPSVATQNFGFNLDDKKDKFIVISAGRLVPLKGFDMTIRAFAIFLRNLPSKSRERCELQIVGAGPELNTYKRLCSEFGIEQQTKFVSWIGRNDLMNEFKKASAFVFPSHEGAGMVVAEALSFGLPVICLDNCGPGEFINKDCGFAVSYTDYDQTVREISAGIKKLFNDPDLSKRMALSARERFLTHFHWDQRGEQFRKVYLNL
jgi:glycosyltransferase involved in cell wall biosynthesis